MKKAPVRRGPGFIDDDMRMVFLDCPKCKARESCLPMTICIECKKFYVSGPTKWRAEFQKANPDQPFPIPSGRPPKNVCPHCRTDQREWRRRNRRMRRGAGRRPAATRARSRPSSERLRQSLKYAPPGAIGVIHANMPAVRKAFLPLLKQVLPPKDRTLLGPADALAAKIEAVDCFFVKTFAGPLPVVAARGPITPKDVAAFLEKVPGMKLPLQKRENGRYALGPMVQMVAGREAKDVENNVLLIGMMGMLGETSVATMGSGGALGTLLKKVDTSADAWMAADIADFVPSPNMPRQVRGSLRVGRKDGLSLDVTFAGPQAAAKAREMLVGKNGVLPKLLSVRQTRAKLHIRLPSLPGEAVVPIVISSLMRANKMARRTISGANLNTIGKAVFLYRAEFDDATPTSLAKLIECRTISALILTHPATGRRLKTDAKGIPTEPGDYIYIVLPHDAPADLVMAYERPEINRGEGVNVLFADTKVRWLDMKTFKEHLDKTHKWLKQRGR